MKNSNHWFGEIDWSYNLAIMNKCKDPLERAIYDSVRKTNRAVIVEESWPFASVGSHLAWLLSSNCFDALDAPVELVACEDVPMPYNHTLELAVQPSVEKIIAAAKRACYMEDGA